MRSTKIRPEVVGKSVRTVHKESFWNEESGGGGEYEIDEKEDGEYDVRRQSGYWHARSLFLKSYRFSEARVEEGWRKKMKRRAKEANKKAKVALVGMGRKALVCSRRFDVKLLAMKVEFPTAKAIVKCFVPTMHN